jgi:4-hydroxy-2-oxoheptanedioate aldolase
MANQIKSPVVDATGKTRLRESLERAKRGEGPSIGQWLEFPGYSLARTVAPLGEDVSCRTYVDPELWVGCLTESDVL